MLQIIVRIILQPLFWLFYWPKPKNWRYLNKSGPVIYMSNHKRWFDVFIIILSSMRVVYILGKQELFENKLFGAVLRGLNAFPVSRGTADVSAIKQSINILKEGKVLLIFPEGTRTKGEELNTMHDGVSLIALKSKASIVPINIQNDYDFFHHAKVTIGEPIDIKKLELQTDKLNTKKVSEILFKTLANLHKGE